MLVIEGLGQQVDDGVEMFGPLRPNARQISTPSDARSRAWQPTIASTNATRRPGPLEGLVMATRAGFVDPGLVLWLLQYGDLSLGEVAHGLEHEAGLAALTGGSGDMRDVVAGVERGDPDSCLAFALHSHRLRREIAAMAAALGGLDVVVFTGGIGEHQPTVRSAATDGLRFLGLAVDPVRNSTASGDLDISTEGSACAHPRRYLTGSSRDRPPSSRRPPVRACGLIRTPPERASASVTAPQPESVAATDAPRAPKWPNEQGTPEHEEARACLGIGTRVGRDGTGR